MFIISNKSMQALHRFDYFGYFIYLEQNIYFAILSNNPNAIFYIFCCPYLQLLMKLIWNSFLFAGTIISAFTVFCGCPTKIEKRMNAFLLNILAGFLQMVTFIIIVGWIWSILWGMNFVQLASKLSRVFYLS